MSALRNYTSMTGDILLKHLREIRPELEFEQLFPRRSEDTAEIIARLYSRLHKFIDHPEQDKITDPQLYSALIGWKATTTSMAALEIFRKGYPTEAVALLRNVVETAAVIIHLRQNPGLHDAVLSGKHDPTTSIGVAKKAVSVIGKFYGALCLFSHMKAESSFPGHIQAPAGGNHSLLIGGGFDPSQKAMYTVLLNDIELALFVLESSLELALYPLLSDMRHWKYSNGSLERVITDEVQKRIVEMELLTLGPEALGELGGMSGT